MMRREFITLLGGAAAAWPLAARAHRRARAARRRALIPSAAEMRSRYRLTRSRGSAAAGLDGGSKPADRLPLGNGNADRLRAHSAELIALAPDVILAASVSSMMPLLEATRRVPIVFVQTIDPVGVGFVESLARPGGNITGFTQFEYSMTREMVGAAQGDRAGLHAWPSFATPAAHGIRTVCRLAVGGAGVRGRVEPGQRS